MKAKDILKQARYTLSDMDGRRWTDERLLSILNAGIVDIAKNTTIFVENLTYVVQNNVVDIDLSDVATRILRAEYLDKPLPFYSMEEMDRGRPVLRDRSFTHIEVGIGGTEWQLDRGNRVKALVYDKQKNGLLKQYPIVEDARNDLIVQNSPYGMVTDLSYSDVQPILAEGFGDIGEVPAPGLVKIYYVRRHAKVTDINTELVIDELTELPLVKWVTGWALRDNQDAQNRSLATEELKFYYQMVEEYSIQKSTLFVEADHTVKYRPMT